METHAVCELILFDDCIELHSDSLVLIVGVACTHPWAPQSRSALNLSESIP